MSKTKRAAAGMAFAAALAVTLGLVATVAHAEPYAFPSYADAAALRADCDRLLADLKDGEQKLQSATDPTAADLLAAFDAMNRRAEDTFGPMELMISVHPDKTLRDAAEACSRELQSFQSRMQRNPQLFALLKGATPADAIDRGYRKKLLEGFEDAGVGLSPERQVRAQQISDDIVKQQQLFSRRVQEDKTLVPFTMAELAGVPEGVWKNAKRDEQGRVLLGLEYPSSQPLLQNATSPAARERMWRAVNRKAGPDNIVTLQALLDLRREYAALFDIPSYADFVLRRRMAQKEEAAQALLVNVRKAVAQRESSDLDELRRAKARATKQPLKATKIERWDVAYYSEQVRRARYALDQEQFRAYFPPEASLDFVFRLSTQLFGVKFAPVQQTLWHADARSFEVSDVASGQALGTLFVDLYPRADKYGHAAVWSFRSVSTLVDRKPAAALVVNFNRQGLTIDELETLLHEFGHAVHALLSTTRYSEQGGTATPRDFVEAPSQMLEDWVYEPTVQALFKDVCPTCKPVPVALLAKAKQAKQFGRGIWVSRQNLYASYDLSLYGREKREPLAEWLRMEGETPVGTVDGSLFPASFGHIAGGYAAGYYSYLWSLVIAEDLRTAFDQHRLDPAVGARYRATVLANGGQMTPDEMLQQFLGRPTDSRAFYKALNKR